MGRLALLCLSLAVTVVSVSAQPVAKVKRWPVKVGDKWGYMDDTGKIAIRARFDEAHHFSEGLAAARIGDKWGYMDDTGKIAFEGTFAGAGPFYRGQALVQIGVNDQGYLANVINTTGKVVKQGIRIAMGEPGDWALGAWPPFMVETMNSFATEAAVRLGMNLYGPMVDRTARFVSRPTDDPRGLQQWMIGGRRVGPMMYGSEPMRFATEGRYVIWQGLDDQGAPRFGFMDASGKEVVKRQYRRVEAFYGGLARVWRGDDMDVFQYIDRSGKVIWPKR